VSNPRPVLLTVDDEPQVLASISRDLRSRYGEKYQVVRASSGAEALEALTELRKRGASVAGLISDQRMPGMEGTEFLGKAAELFPSAKKVLLTAYADTQAAIDSINKIGLDHYLLKPWEPPDATLYPLLDDLLDDWWAEAPAPFDGLRVVGTLWSRACHEVKDFLARNRVPYRWLDIDVDADARKLIGELGMKPEALPVVLFPDGSVLTCPDRNALAAKVGLVTRAAAPFYDLIIIGAGPAGLGAAVYAGSEAVRTVVVEREATGGQAGTSSKIENYLGFPQGLSGTDLATRATTQARRFGVEILHGTVKSLKVEHPYKIVELDDGTTLSSYALLVATGVAVRTLNVPGADRLAGAGLYYGAALTEAAHYQGKEVFVVGGGNSAGQGAMFFARYASKVTVLVRGPDLTATMSDYLIQRITQSGNITVQPFTSICELQGTHSVESMVLEDVRDKSKRTVPASAVFVFIGASPASEFLGSVVARDPDGYVLTGGDVPEAARKSGHRPRNLETSVPGIFAAGDVRAGSSKRVAAAVGEGAVAVGLVHQHLSTV
jgi:thioredoxin reductase (NADPH)